MNWQMKRIYTAILKDKFIVRSDLNHTKKHRTHVYLQCAPLPHEWYDLDLVLESVEPWRK
jgi:hypothetical protein